MAPQSGVKEAIVICVDVGRSMTNPYGDATDETKTYMDAARQFITMALQRKIFSESKDEVGLILFGCQETKNRLAEESLDGNEYQNIAILRDLEKVDWNLIRLVDGELAATDISADWIDALVVAMDLMIEGNEGKKFKARSIILISSFDEHCESDQLASIMRSMKKFDINLTVIGPEFLRSSEFTASASNSQESGADNDEPGPSNAKKRPKREAIAAPKVTSYQRAAAKLVKRILSEVSGDHMSFQEAFPYVTHMQTKSVKPTPWKVNLELGNDLKIPVCGYKKIAAAAVKQSWKRVYDREPDVEVVAETVYRVNDEEAEKVEKEEVAWAYSYGSSKTIIEKEELEMHAKFKTGEKCLKLLGFTSEKNIQRWQYTGDGVYHIFADIQDPSASVALSALIHALYETGMLAVARYSYHSGCAPKMVVLVPRIKANIEYLIMIVIPFADDYHHFYFPPLQSSEKFKPSKAQLKLVDELITSLDLSAAEVDPSGERIEAIKPKSIRNPAIQRHFQACQYRVLHPDDALPELSPSLLRQFETPSERVNLANPVWEKMKEEFKLKIVEKENKRSRNGNAANAERLAEIQERSDHVANVVQNNLDGNLQDLQKAAIFKVGTVDPIGDFEVLVERNPDGYADYAKQVLDVLTRFIFSSIGTQTYGKAVRILREFREVSLKNLKPDFFNDYLRTVKHRCIELNKDRADFWTDFVAKNDILLISSDEVGTSSVSRREAEEFALVEDGTKAALKEPEKEQDEDLKYINRTFTKCWGYEPNCNFSAEYSRSKCDGKSMWPNAQTKDEQAELFWRQADYGFAKERLDSMAEICTPYKKTSSYLACSDHLRYCYARNIFFDFNSFNASGDYNKYRDDVIREGEVGGSCDAINNNVLHSRLDHKSFLQSWGNELENFQSFANFQVDERHCDVIIDKPSIIIKLDAGISMYHHFCDFVNLYLSQHLNGSFSRDVQIVIWDTSVMPYHDFFAETWKVFTDLPLMEISDFDGKKACFREAMFPLLARMQLGLYYNMPLINGCNSSGLIQHFAQHVLHRLKIRPDEPVDGQVRVTLLSRSSKHRRILNEDELLEALRQRDAELDVRKVDYNLQIPFHEQLQVTQNSDIFIGMHGSGLTHLLFLPDWAAVFEIYNCDDANCYSDLARLRGVRYFTWERSDLVVPADEGKHPTLGTPHAKFTDYSFDVDEFVRIVLAAADYVRSHPQFRRAQERKSQQNKAKQEL